MTNKLIKSTGFLALAAGLGFLVPQIPVVAQDSGLAMLDGLTKGAWTVRLRGESTPRRICVRTGRELIQIRHRQNGCNRFVVEDGASEVTVQYACAGDGYGRTNIRRETAGLVQIESQGIAGGLPFELTAEARRVGNCN